MSRYPDEKVLVIPRSLFTELGAFQGISLEPERYLPSILDPANNSFLARDLAEEDPSFKQIIPYAIFCFENRFLHYTRGAKGGEKRLAAKGSIGIGGHVNDSDQHESSLDARAYHRGFEREINEELLLSGPYTHKIVGLINDDSNAVGQVHLGVVHLVTLSQGEVSSAEDQLQQLEFLTLAELNEKREKLETWSQICVDGLSQFWRAG
jgi:predicted NUDIX family phosphoesterase